MPRVFVVRVSGKVAVMNTPPRDRSGWFGFDDSSTPRPPGPADSERPPLATSEPSVRPPHAQRWRVPPWLADRNPCYLLSGVLMLFGCFAVSQGIQHEDDNLPKLLAIVTAVEVYGLLLVAAASWLARHERFHRDALLLIVLALVLLLDGTGLTHACMIQHAGVGAAVGGVAWLLGMVKLIVAARITGARLTGGGWAMIGANLAVVFGLPILLRTVAGHPGELLWMAWVSSWLVAGVVAAHALVGPWRIGQPGFQRRQRLGGLCHLGWLLPLMLIGGAVARLPMLMSIYGVPWRVELLAPVLIGFGFIFAQRQRSFHHKFTNNRLAGGLTLLAKGCVLWPAPELMMQLTTPMNYEVAPMTWVWPTALGVAAFAWWRHGGLLCLASSFVHLVAGLLGRSLKEIARHVRQLAQLVMDYMPNTLLGWGVMAMVVAFTMLLCGVARSIQVVRSSAVSGEPTGDRAGKDA